VFIDETAASTKIARLNGRYLPQYSPDFNPIELGFSKVKSKLRKAAERTVKGLCRRIGLISRSFKTQECRNFFRHAGYG